MYYANNQDVTKGNSHYNVAGDVKVTGVDVKTGSVSGTVGGKMTVESVQDEFTSEGRGYSVGISAGIGKGFDRNNPKGYGANLSSISAGHTRTDMEQRITRNVTEFTAGAGFLDVKGTVKQVGSLIDGNFTLNSGGYEHEDLKDIDKSRTVGINVTVYPNVSYSQRDRNGNQVYVDGSNPKKTGTAVKTGFTYGETDKTREILATVGAGVAINHDLSGVNRDPNRQVTEFEGRELKPVNVDLLAEYWATEAGRGKLRDMLENAERTTDGIRRILTTRDENGNLNILKSVEAESAVQKFMRIGYVDTKGKTQQQVKQELEARFGSLAKKGVKVYFYGEKDVDTSRMDENTRAKLDADGFAVTKDGTVWINKEHVDSGKVIDFNTLTQHEISHIIFGEDSEYQAQYVEKAYGEFLKDVQNSGYGQDGQGIIDYKMSMLNDEDSALLNGYIYDNMQFWEVMGDYRIDNRVHLNSRAGKVVYQKQLNEIGRLERAYKKIDARIAKDKKIGKLRNKKNITRGQSRKLAKATGDIYSEELRNAYAEEKYENVRAVDTKTLEYLIYVQQNPKTRNEYKGYNFQVVGMDENGKYIVSEKLGNPEDKVIQDNILKNSYRSDLKNHRQNTMKDFVKDIDEGRAIASYGFWTIGYGVTPEYAEMNRKHKISSLGSGLFDTGKGVYKMKVGAGAISAGAGACSTGVGCTGGVGFIGAGIGVAGAGVNNVVTGVQKIGYAFSDRGMNLHGKTAAEVYSAMNKNSKEGMNISYYEVYNPLKEGVKFFGGTEKDYVTLDMITDAYAPTLSMQSQLQANINSMAAPRVTYLNEAKTKALIETPNEKKVVQVTQNGNISSYGLRNGHQTFSSDSSRAVEQIENTIGQNIMLNRSSAQASDTTKSLFEGVTGYTSKTLIVPENYYNVRASSGYLRYGSQQSVIKIFGYIIKPENFVVSGNFITPDRYIGIRNNNFYTSSLGYEIAQRGITGVPAKNLVEQLTVEEALSNPLIGHPKITNLGDSRWKGWDKYEYTHRGLNNINTTIHYDVNLENGVIIQLDDIKMKK